MSTERNPTFKQQWVLSCCGSNNLLYEGNLRESFGPFRISNDSVMKSFLKRMEKSGWLLQDSNPPFWHLTQKSIHWKKKTKKEATDFYYEYYKTPQP